MARAKISFATNTNSFYNFQVNFIIFEKYEMSYFLVMCECANGLICEPYCSRFPLVSLTADQILFVIVGQEVSSYKV